MRAPFTPRLLVPLALFAVAIPACGNDDETTTSPASAGPATVSVTFNATNNGPDDDHEFVVIQTDLSPTDLPTKPDGSVDEEGAGITVIDEIEPFAVGKTETLTVDLDAGSYALICNVYDAKEKEAHYMEGMRTGFTVT